MLMLAAQTCARGTSARVHAAMRHGKMHREFGLSDERLRNRMLQHEYDFARSSSTPLHSAATKASNLGFCLLMLALNNSG